ncbi:MAG TPA: phosphatase PAP2 family protein [Saprospiraceae bacterium]|nr:phosphatase PAP2 family protein [Saprospiraceae bacterium]
MKAFYLFISGAGLFIILGFIASLTYEKVDFLIWLSASRNTIADYYFYYITKLGESYAFVFFSLFFLITSWRKMVPVPVLGLIVSIMSHFLKIYFRHERPSVYLEKMKWDGNMSVLDYHILGGDNSFPSGHSMAAWAIFTLAALLIRKTWFSILALFLAFSVSISRVYLMAHFLQDVVAGAAIGFLLGFGVYYGYARWMKKHAETPSDVKFVKEEIVDVEKLD